MTDIPGYETFAKIEPIKKGWSGDKKYYIETEGGRRLLLRVSDVKEHGRKKAEYEMLGRVAALGVPTSAPVAFGLYGGGRSVYQLLAWVDGEDAQTVLPTLTGTEQYALGLKAGVLLRKIHAVPAPQGMEDWAARFRRKVRGWTNKYHFKPKARCATGAMLVRYLKENRHVLAARPQTLIHGDYNAENIIAMPGGEVGVIDFSSYNSAYGDPWWDFNNVAWMPTLFPPFYTGQMQGYWGGEPPVDFWKVYTYYLAYDALAALTDLYGLNGLEDGAQVVQNILAWTSNFHNPVPTWYGVRQ